MIKDIHQHTFLSRQLPGYLYNSYYRVNNKVDIALTLKVAILEDELAQAKLLESWLLPALYDTKTYSTGQSLLDALKTSSFDFLLVDWELPDINGPEVMQIIRTDLKIDTPIIFITSRDSEDDIVLALNTGADDYLVKPLRQFEFLARLKANTRRSQQDTIVATTIDKPPYTFNPDNQQTTLHGNLVELAGKEFELAYFLFSHEGQLLERKTILSTVWQQEAELNTRTVDTHISIIRKKLAIGPQNNWRLKSVYGHGYRLEKLSE